MSILILATSGPRGELALAREGRALTTLPLADGAARGRGVMPAVRTLLEDQGPAGIEAILVDVGPGSFTGMRVGVTTAKALAFSLGAPLVGVLSLAALAEGVEEAQGVMAVRDAGRGRLYYAAYGPAAEGGRPTLAGPGREAAHQVAARAQGLIVVGEAASTWLAGHALDTRERAADAAAILAVGRRDLDAGRTTPPHVLAPVYLQASAPERRLAGEKDGEAPAAPLPNRP